MNTLACPDPAIEQGVGETLGALYALSNGAMVQ
jgi:hypothetical protein